MTDDPTLRGPSDGSGDGLVLSERQVKQGRTGTRTLVILLVSIVLVAIVMFGIYALSSRGLRAGAHGGQEGAGSHAASNAFHSPEPSPKPAPAPGP